MKILLGLLIAVCICMMTMTFPVQAGSFGLSPASVTIQMNQSSSKDLQFTIIGYDGLVEISSESMPVSVSPTSVVTKAGSNITVTIKCNSDATTGLYDGRIVLLAKSGNSVMSGIKVRCNLTVGNPPSSFSPIVGSSGLSGSSIGNLGNNTTSSSIGVSSTETVTSNNSVIPPLASSTPTLIQNIQNQGKETLPVQATEIKSFNYVLFGIIVISGLLLIGAFFVGYRWMMNRRKI